MEKINTDYKQRTSKIYFFQDAQIVTPFFLGFLNELLLAESGGCYHMKRSGLQIKKPELKTYKRPIWASREPPLKIILNRLDYQPLADPSRESG